MALKIGTNFGNNYELARNIISTRQLFNQEDWEYNAVNGNLDAYIDAVYNSNNELIDKLHNEYNYDYADSKTRTWALFNEAYGDKTVEETDKYRRTRYKKDEEGNYVLVNGKPQEETYYASDYDYYKEIINEYNEENQRLYLRKLEQQAKDEIGPVGQFFASLTAELGEVVSGFWGSIDSLLTGIAGLTNATIKSIEGENWSDAYVEYVGDDKNYLLGSKRLEYLLTEFERKYTTIRDIDGNLTSAGGFFIGLANSTGQMLPAFITSFGVGKAGKALGWSEKAISATAQISSSAVFYGSMTIDNIHDTYQYFKQNGVSVSSSAIIGNAVLKSALQLVIELGLGKITNHFSKLDQLVFGRGASRTAAGATSSLGSSLFARVMTDFTQEGMEEVFQDLSDYFVDQLFSMIDENFGELSNITAEDLMLSFTAGGIMSLSGHALGIAKRAVDNRLAQSMRHQVRVEAHNAKVEAHNAEVNATGKGKTKELWGVDANPLIGVNEKTGKPKRLNSALSYEYNLNLQAFMQNFATILELGKNFSDTDVDVKFEEDINSKNYGKQIKSDKLKRTEKGKNKNLVYKNSKAYDAYQSAVAEMYIAYRLIGSIYNADPNAFTKANEILTQMQDMAKLGKFNRKLMSEHATSLVGETMNGIQANQAAVISKIKEAEISRVKGIYDKNTPITDASLDEKTREALEELVTNGNIDRVVVTEDGKHLVITDNVAFVQLKQLQNGGVDSIYESMAEETLVNGLIDGRYGGVGIKEVTTVYREVSGRPDATEHEAALSLFLNDSFFRIMLSTANKDTLHLLDSLLKIEQQVVPDKQRTAKYKQKLNHVIENMHKAVYEYLLNQVAIDPNAVSILSTEEKKKIRQVRWCKNLYARVTSKTEYKKLTNDDWRVLTNRINAMPADAEIKTAILNNLKSDNQLARISAMNKIATIYRNIFTSMYDGKTYMPDNSIPNRVFNTYLQQNGLTIETLISENVSEEIKTAVTNMFGEFNIDNLLKFHQAQFGITCNNKWIFKIDEKNNVSIYETGTLIQVGFSEYKNAYTASEFIQSRNITEDTNIERMGVRHDALGKLLHPNLAPATAAYITIDDVIANPMLLSDDIKQKIADKYNSVDTETTFRYLQDYFINTTKNTTVIVLQDGSYAFGNIRPMQKLLRNADRKINLDDKLTIKDLISERYLYGRLATISITSVTDKSSKSIQESMKGSIAAYVASSNTIYLNKQLFADYSQDFIKFAILHEFQHAMQYENGMNLGLNVNWLMNDDINADVRKKIVEDIRKHCPEIFGEKSYGENKLIIPGTQGEARIAQEFVYYCSGESTAYGVDAQQMINFYPFIVSANNVGVETLKMPWGTQYNLSTGMPTSLFVRDKYDKLTEVLSTDEYKEYFDISNRLYRVNDYSDLSQSDKQQMVALESARAEAIRKTEQQMNSDMTYAEINAISNYVGAPVGVSQNLKTAKRELVEVLSDKTKQHMLRLMYLDSGLKVPFEQFLDMNVPIVRIQQNVESKKDAFLSASLIPASFDEEMNISVRDLIFTMAKHYTQGRNEVLVVGTIKPKDMIGYFNHSLHEVLVPVDVLNSFKKYNIAIGKNTTKIDVDTISTIDRDIEFVTPISFAFDVAQQVVDIIRNIEEYYNFPELDSYGRDKKEHELLEAEFAISTKREPIVRSRSREELTINEINTLLDFYYGDLSAERFTELNNIEKQRLYNYSALEFAAQYFKDYDINLTKLYREDPTIYVQEIMSDTINTDSQFSTVEVIDNLYNVSELYNAMLTFGDKTINIRQIHFSDILLYSQACPGKIFVDKSKLQDFGFDVNSSITINTQLTDKGLTSTSDYQQGSSLGEVREDIRNIKSLAAPTGESENKKPKKKKIKVLAEDTAGKRKLKQRTGAKGLDRIYVSQAMGKDTALEKYGYTGKYKRTYMSKGTYDFIRQFDENLLFKNDDGKLNTADEKLLTALKSGKATSSDILDYFRDATDMKEEMFDLINDSFFKNKFITTFKDLQKHVLESGQYYALRTIMRIAKLDEKFIENADEDLFMHAVKLINKLNGKVTYNGKTININQLFEQISNRYNNNDFVYSERLLRRLWMQYYDGTAATGGYIAGVARWAAFYGANITGEGTSRVKKSTNEAIGGTDLTMEDVVADTADDFAQLFDNMTTTQKIQQIQVMLSLQSGIDFENVDKMDDKKRKKFMQWFHEIGIKLEDLSIESLDKYYEKQYKRLTESQRQTIIRMSLALEAGNMTYAQLKEKEATKLQDFVVKSEAKTARPSSAIVASMRGLLRTIKNNVGQNVYKQLIKDNEDIFDSKLNLKTDDMKEVINKRTVYKSPEILEPILERIRAIVQDVKEGVYDSSKSVKAKTKMQRELEKLKSDYERLKVKYAQGGKTRVIKYEVSDNTIEIESDRQIPAALKRILDNTFTKTAKTQVQFLTEQEAEGKTEQQAERHIKMNLSSFVETNAEYLAALTQSDVDEIIDFYLHSEIIPTTNKARQYAATRIYLLGYFLTNKLGTEKGAKIDTRDTAEWMLSEQQRNDVTANIENVISINAAVLSAWKATMQSFKPENLIISSLAKRNDIEFSVEDIDNLVDAVQSRDPERIKAAQSRMYDNARKKYVQTSKKLTFDSFLQKVLNFERMCMLSGPGTWIRNWSSNFIVQGGNWASGKIGQLVSKVFPKKWKREGQYQIIGTKVDANTKSFITEQIVKSGLLKLLGNSLSKYDTRKSQQVAVSTDESVIELLKESIRSNILYDNGYNNKILDLVNRGLGKMLSDNRWIDKQTIYYLSRTLIEDHVDLSKGLTKPVIEHLANAYRMAAQDYMHKSNIFNVLEAKVREKLGMKAYFLYKQILPFASAGWNWFVEGLNYTPLGLVKSIIQYAKLEKTITTLENAQQKGDFTGIPSGFAQYGAIRNLGKGVLGTIGCIAGILLAACGIAGIDEEDDKYKLHIGDVYIDISSIFGTQGIFMGITITSAIVNSIQKSNTGDEVNVADELWSVFKTALDATFADSTLDDVVSTFRYSSSVGDWFSNIPFTMMGMLVPNFLKQLLSFAPTKSIQYSKGIQGKLEKMVVQNLPVLAYAFPKQVDPYTGETQVPYVTGGFIQLLNKLMPFDIAPYRFSDTEKEASDLGLKKGQLTGSYEINGEKFKLKSSEVHDANTYYGKLNKKDLNAFMKNKTSYKVWDDKKNKYVTLKYSQMTDKQKANVIDRIMSNNASLAKIYILTSTNRYKYFASDSEYKELRKAGITKNLYKATEKKSGFVK